MFNYEDKVMQKALLKKNLNLHRIEIDRKFFFKI